MSYWLGNWSFWWLNQISWFLWNWIHDDCRTEFCDICRIEPLINGTIKYLVDSESEDFCVHRTKDLSNFATEGLKNSQTKVLGGCLFKPESIRSVTVVSNLMSLKKKIEV